MLVQGPGFGKTTAGAGATLAMQVKFGKTLCTALTHVATDNFVARLQRRNCAIVEALNKDVKPMDTRRRRKLVVRVHKEFDELTALDRLLENPKLKPPEVIPKRATESKWTLELSLAFWLLTLVRSEAVRELHADDPKVLFDIQTEMDADNSLAGLRDLATGRIDWDEYRTKSRVEKAVFSAWMKKILVAADFMGCTPAATANDQRCRD